MSPSRFSELFDSENLEEKCVVYMHIPRQNLAAQSHMCVKEVHLASEASKMCFNVDFCEIEGKSVRLSWLRY